MSSDVLLKAWAESHLFDQDGLRLLNRIQGYRKSINEIAISIDKVKLSEASWNEEMIRKWKEASFSLKNLLQVKLQDTSLSKIDVVFYKEKVALMERISDQINSLSELLTAEKSFLSQMAVLFQKRIAVVKSIEKNIAAVKHGMKPFRNSLSALNDLP